MTMVTSSRVSGKAAIDACRSVFECSVEAGTRILTTAYNGSVRGDVLMKAVTTRSSTLPMNTSMKPDCVRIYGRNSRVTLMTNARVDSSDQRSPSAPVFRSSVYTTNSSLPGAHSHRSRKFPLTV